MEIHGQVEAGFEGVRDAFGRNFVEHGDVGAAFALHVEGRKVVDIWGGTTSPGGTDPYGQDALQLVFSSTKGATAACANLLAQRGLLDVDAPVVTYWPEFGQAGKQHIPVRWLLCHQAGLPVIDEQLSLSEALAWEPVIDALERQAPAWEPGTAHGYHALTFGWLVGEVIRRVDGRTLGAFFQEEIAQPLGLDFWIGLPPEQEARVAPLVEDAELAGADPSMRALIDQFMGPDTMLGRALTLSGTLGPDVWNLPEVHAAQIGAASGITNARSLSRFYAGLVGPLNDSAAAPLLGQPQIDLARRCLTRGADRVLSVEPYTTVESTFGLGFITTSLFGPFGGAGAFGHAGAGGSVGFADPDHQIAAGYVMNQMQNNLTGDPRTRSLIRASYEAVGAPIAVV
jgi:CubicO group peptidase (beta-lactamase class C family)